MWSTATDWTFVTFSSAAWTFGPAPPPNRLVPKARSSGAPVDCERVHDPMSPHHRNHGHPELPSGDFEGCCTIFSGLAAGLSLRRNMSAL